MRLSLAITLLLLGCIACTYYNHNFLYNFEEGIEIINLDDQLDEISGLFYKDATTLYAIQDEEGEIFEINTTTGEHKKIVDFKKEGDFEGIAESKGVFYALESDGDIFKINKDGTDEKFEFFNDDKDFEFEGLTLDKKTNSLLVACKKHGKNDMNDDVFIYSFSLSNNEYNKDPFLRVSQSAIHSKFKASGLTINSKGNLYLISAISFTIVEISRTGEVINKAQLPYSIYNQVEGICFGKNNILYISSEKAKGDKAKIIKVQPIEK